MTPTNTLLVTAFLADTPEDIKCLTSSDYGKPVYLRIIETMTECDEMKQVVITDIDLCAAAARTYGFKVLNPVGEDQNKEPYLTINEHISNSKGSFFYQFNTIIVLDRHYPFVSSETIKQAFKKFKKNNCKTLFSVSETRDNTIQIKQGYKLHEMGLISFLDKHEKPEWLNKFNAMQRANGNDLTYETTLPFPLSWSSFSIHGELKDGEIAMLCQLGHNFHHSYFFVTRQHLNYFYYENTFILGYYRRENKNMARFLLEKRYNKSNTQQYQIVGVHPFDNQKQHKPHCITIKQKYNDSELYFCVAKKKLPYNIKVCIWPYIGGSIVDNDVVEKKIYRCNRYFNQNEKSSNIYYRYSLSALPERLLLQTHGFSYAVISDAIQEKADYFEPLEFNNSPYSYDPHKRTILNSYGNIVNGRQKFSKIFVKNSAITILNFNNNSIYRDKEKAIHTKNYFIEDKPNFSFPIPEHESFMIEDVFDYAQL